MPRRGKRRRIAKYIYADQSGIAGIVTVRGTREEQRFPAGTPIPEVRRALETRRRELDETLPELPARGTLAALVKHYLDSLPTGAHRNQREDLLQPWVEAFGDHVFVTLRRAELLTVLEGWRHAGLSASRTNKRISALRVVWRQAAPDHAWPHAIERVSRYAEPKPEARAISMQLAQRIIEAVPVSKSRARLAVLAWTGQPPARVMQIEPHHVRWSSSPPELYVQPRRKGAGTTDAWLPLLPEAQRALRQFFQQEAGGAFQTSALLRTFKRAVKVVQTGLRKAGRDDDAARLDGVNVYTLRHSFATWFAQRVNDPWALAEYLGHTSLATMSRYTRGASSARTKAAIATLRVPTRGANGRRHTMGRKRTRRHKTLRRRKSRIPRKR